MHKTLHDLPRLCRPGRPDTRALTRATLALVRYYKRFPSRRCRLQIDDESGSMLSALLVLRDELTGCSARLTKTVDEVLPTDIRRALGPPDPSPSRAPE